MSSQQIATAGLSSKVDYVSDQNNAAQETGRTKAELNRRVEIVPINR